MPAIATGLAPLAATAQAPFHVTFGTSGDPYRNADSAAFVAETVSGDLIVAGSGAAFWLDTGQDDTIPLVARIDARGRLRWQRIYKDFENHRIVGFTSHGESQYMILEQTMSLGQLLDSPTSPVTLHRIDERGAVSEVLATLEGFRILQTIPVVDGELRYFLIAGKAGATYLAAHAADVQLFRLDLEGRVQEVGFPRGVKTLVHLLHTGGQEFLFTWWHHERDHVADARRQTDMHTDIVRLDPTGEIEIVRSLADAVCQSLAGSRDRIVCTEVPSLRTEETIDAIVAYSAAGQELWRRALERDVFIGRMQLLDSGELIYSYQDGQSTIVSRLSPSGEPIWRQALRSAGQYTFLTAIEPLKNGRLAFLGSTGPWSPYSSADTSAMLLVTSPSADDLDASEIVSHIVGPP